MRRDTEILSILLTSFMLSVSSMVWAAQAQGAEQLPELEAARREDLLLQAVQRAYTPPQAGIMPSPDEIPMHDAWEDPDWDTPLMQSIYRNPYSYGNNLDNFLPCLREALSGNPKAMLALSMYYYLWGYTLEERYADFPPQVHNADYWRDWAERLTSPGWVRLRLGDLHGRWPVSSLEYYRQGAELGNAEAMYNYYKISGKRSDYLYRSAAFGFAKAAFLLSEELLKRGDPENLDLARRYTWLAAINADEWGLLHSSFSFYNNDFSGPFNNCEQGYLYSLLNMRYQYGTSFSAQQPDNICLLPVETINKLNAAADRWQADYEQRRLPQILRGRLKREEQIQAMQDELGNLLNKQGLARLGPGESSAQASGGQGGAERSAPANLAGNWHMGFYSEPNQLPDYKTYDNPPHYAAQHSNVPSTQYIPYVYAFVSLTMLGGAGLILYGQRIKQQKFDKRREG